MNTKAAASISFILGFFSKMTSGYFSVSTTQKHKGTDIRRAKIVAAMLARIVLMSWEISYGTALKLFINTWVYNSTCRDGSGGVPRVIF